MAEEPQYRSSGVSTGPVHHIALSVRSLEDSARFYGGMLGMRRTLRTEGSGPSFTRLLGVDPDARARVWYFDGGGQIGQIELVEWQNYSIPTAPPRSPYDLTVLAFSVSAADFDPVLATAESEGFPIDGGPETFDLPGYGEVRSVLMRDPDGHRVEIVALPDAAAIRARRDRERAGSQSGI
jgi:catechol 2,3-dioxygenase-like lactoylglutathione lyase family enzyme